LIDLRRTEDDAPQSPWEESIIDWSKGTSQKRTQSIPNGINPGKKAPHLAEESVLIPQQTRATGKNPPNVNREDEGVRLCDETLHGQNLFLAVLGEALSEFRQKVAGECLILRR